MDSSTKLTALILISIFLACTATPVDIDCGSCGGGKPTKPTKPTKPIVKPPVKLPPVKLPPVKLPPVKLPPVKLPPVKLPIPPVGGLPIPPVGGLPIPPVGGLPIPPVGGLIPPVGGLPIPPVGGLVPPVGGLPIPPVGGLVPPVGGLPIPPVGGLIPPVSGLIPPVGGLIPPVGGGKGCPPPTGESSTDKCPIDTLKLGACVDLLGGLVHVSLGDPVANECCPILAGLVELEAAACLCTTIKLKLLNLKIFVPVALELLITCGKSPPPGYTCSI